MSTLINPVTLYNQALKAAKANNLPEAERLLKQLVRAFPDHERGLMLLAQVTSDQFPEERLRYAERAMRAHPESERAYALFQRLKADPALRRKKMTVDEWLAAIDEKVRDKQIDAAHELALQAVELYPENQKLLLALATSYRRIGHFHDVILTWDRVAKINPTTEEGKEADKLLANAPSVISDKERGSMLLAVREAVGITLFFLLLAWQDSGLDLMQLGAQRWQGLALSLIGGYLLVTAASAPQQGIFAWLLGKKPKEPRIFTTMRRGQSIQTPTMLPTVFPEFRVLLGSVGAMMLVAAFVFVFHTSLGLLVDPGPVPMPEREEVRREISDLIDYCLESGEC